MVTMEHKLNPQFSKAHLTTLNLNNFKMIEAMGLEFLHRGPLEWYNFPTKFNGNLSSGSEVISGGRTDRHTDWRLDKPTFILQTRIKRYPGLNIDC
jgi:hypothetical protein